MISDISALSYDYRYEFKKLRREEKYLVANNYFLKVYVSFNDWAEVNKWDFEQVIEFHSTAERQYLTGIIHFEKLKNAAWFYDPSISVILLPDGIVEKETIVTRSLKKVSLQLAGVN